MINLNNADSVSDLRRQKVSSKICHYSLVCICWSFQSLEALTSAACIWFDLEMASDH